MARRRKTHQGSVVWRRVKLEFCWVNQSPSRIRPMPKTQEAMTEAMVPSQVLLGERRGENL